MSLLEAVALQQAQERVFPFIQYLDDTPPETRKRRKKWADLCEVISKEGGIEEVFDLGFTTPVKRSFKTQRFSWPVNATLASSGKLDIVNVDKTRIWDKPVVF